MRKPITARLIGAAVLALVAAFALRHYVCSAGDEKPELAGARHTDLVAPDNAAPPSERGQGPQRRSFIPITVEEVAPLVPQITGAETLVPLQTVAGGRRVNTTLCVTIEDPSKTSDELKQKLGGLGFELITSSSRPQRLPLKTIHWMRAKKGIFRMAASVHTAEYTDCKGSANKSKVFLAYFKREEKPSSAAGGAAGAPGQQNGSGQGGPAGSAATEPSDEAPEGGDEQAK
jgi:hypothetical protein